MSETKAAETELVSVAVPKTASGEFKYPADALCDPEAAAPVRLFDWHHKDLTVLKSYGGVEQLARDLLSDVEVGLTSAEAANPLRQETYGSNKLVERKGLSYWELVWEKLHDFTLIVLMVAAAVSIVLGIYAEGWESGWVEGVAILVAVVIVVNVASINDLQKDKQFRKLNAVNNRVQISVLRDGRVQEIFNDDVVVGDVLCVTTGKQIPADGIFISGSNVKMDESKLTGESDHVKKDRDANPFIVSSTQCHEGEFRMLVVAVGPYSVFGRMRTAIDAETDEVTPLQEKLEILATQISKLGFAVGVLTVIVMIIRHIIDFSSNDRSWSKQDSNSILGYFITGVTILVVAIPEGLPLAVTIALAYSVKRMMKDSNLVRHLDACETMGGANTVCSDKTGTLTQNNMTVMQAWVASEGWRLLSRFERNSAEEVQEFLTNCRNVHPIAFEALVHNAALTSGSTYIGRDEKGAEVGVGSKTDVAMLFWSNRLNRPYEAVRGLFPKLKEEEMGADAPCQRADAAPETLLHGVVHSFPFSSARKRSSVLVRMQDGTHRYRLYVKGASEIILRLSDKMLGPDGAVQPLTGEFSLTSDMGGPADSVKARVVREVITPMASEALRTIALAYRDFDAPRDWSDMVTYADADGKGTGECPVVEDGLTLVGIVGIQDPVRPEVPDAVAKCQHAGIFVRMVTGDNRDTARAIARQCNIYRPEGYVDGQGQQWPAGIVMEGPEFRTTVGGLVLPPHFDHVCRCKDYSGRSTKEPRHFAYEESYKTPEHPLHFGYPSIVDQRSERCEYWSPEASASRGGDKCNDECEQRGCRKKMKDPTDKKEEAKYLVVNHHARFDMFVNRLQVLARSAPADKHLLVTGLMERRQVVAVTGDGTNDGPALSKASVGFAMGIAGTEVAKEAADIILMDDNFNSIVKAVMWGRNVYDSIRKFLQFQLTVNIVALALQFVSAVVLRDAPLRAVQMLWVNLIMDTFAALALATELPTEALLDRPPYGRDDSLINRVMLRNMIGHAMYQFAVLMWLVTYGSELCDIPLGSGLSHSTAPTQHFTMIFHSFVMMTLFNEVNARLITGEANVFHRIHTNQMFIAIWFGTLVAQYVIVEIGGLALKVKGLTWEQHGVCVVFGAFSLVHHQLIRFIPATFFPDFNTTGKREDGWVAIIARNNTRRRSFSMRAVVGGSHQQQAVAGHHGSRGSSHGAAAGGAHAAATA